LTEEDWRAAIIAIAIAAIGHVLVYIANSGKRLREKKTRVLAQRITLLSEFQNLVVRYWESDSDNSATTGEIIGLKAVGFAQQIEGLEDSLTQEDFQIRFNPKLTELMSLATGDNFQTKGKTKDIDKAKACYKIANELISFLQNEIDTLDSTKFWKRNKWV